jgi:hypothetical protein
MTNQQKFLTAIRHPEYLEDEMYWEEWRDIYNGGPRFVRRNLKKFSNRETEADFQDRKFYTPIPTFAKSAINDIRNSIFQRLRDVTRREGSDAYMRSCAGEIGGVDNKGSAMQSFLGIDCLTELLVMGKVGVYVDMPELSGLRTMADEDNARPYTYMYKVEDILSWTAAKPEEPGDFTAILLRDHAMNYNQGFAPGVYLPSEGYVRYRFMWLDPSTRKVKMKLYNEQDQLINLYGEPLSLAKDDVETIDLELDRIPFTIMDIGGSLLKDVYKHQVALLNLGSSDVSYALKANYPFFIEQKDVRAVGSHLKKTVSDDGTTVTSDNSKPGEEGRTGVTHGRTYDLKADAPSFIHPSPEPLMASMKLQEKLEDDIRKLVNLAVQNKMGQRAVSAEAMKLSDQGLEAGLSYIGLVMESAERSIANHWAAYENKDPDKRKIATVKYPDRYSLKNDEDRIKEAKELSSLMYSVPGKTVKKELSKNIVSVLLAGKVNTDTLDKINSEINSADYATSDPEIIIRAQEQGLCGEQVASEALGFDEDEYLTARADHEDRAKRIAQAQSDVAMDQKKKEADLNIETQEKMIEKGLAPDPTAPPPGAGPAGPPSEGGTKPVKNPAARGQPDLDVDRQSGKKERAEATDTELKADKKKPVRGQGKSLNKGSK